MSRPSKLLRDSGKTSIWNLIKERLGRARLYDAAAYWDARARVRTGNARSLWPSNVYNEVWDARQRELLMRLLDVRSRRVLDVGCGTGRLTRFIAAQGASEVVGIDFASLAIDAANKESPASSELDCKIRYVVGDVLAGLEPTVGGEFDVAISIGTLAMACRDREALETALMNIARVVHRGGHVLLMEPIHARGPLRRINTLGVRAWNESARRVGLRRDHVAHMGFVPFRLVLSVRDLPFAAVDTAFRAGEWALDHAPLAAPMADYTVLRFIRE